MSVIKLKDQAPKAKGGVRFNINSLVLIKLLSVPSVGQMLVSWSLGLDFKAPCHSYCSSSMLGGFH
jgi:hypothetical protein